MKYFSKLIAVILVALIFSNAYANLGSRQMDRGDL